MTQAAVAAADYQRIEVRPLTPSIGAEIHSVDLTQPLDEQTFQEIHAAFLAHQVIFFRDQQIDIEQHKAFGRMFGELHIHPAAPSPEGHPEILVIHADEKSKFVAGNTWHSDVSCDAEPPLGSILHMHTLPSSGGDTMFASMYAAYEALSETMRKFLSGLTAVHGSEHVYRGRYKDFGVEDAGKVYPKNEHPVVRTHPESGRKGLYVNSGFTTRINGLEKSESRALLDFLFAHVAQPEFHCRFKWAENSIAFWDNRCVQHYALWDYYPQVRHGLRVTVKGSKPV
ncbi:MAG: TauD/TfdA family dioxygenase [SAR324 cluster bacterium]|nr:TauD/TfdA family dioxygenase [SAR324 cluster bacterium]MCZ6532120.1 TauD/TfdA family dioxygenase [SAR324 cluster bacterium]MCZ6626721.1 TauD/TfdA family dioxygenase [SAR324 cluster bacterium]MCZ6647007.1 TauD/TfdA family dioxygenase [SAR324 cluster bacterium]